MDFKVVDKKQETYSACKVCLTRPTRNAKPFIGLLLGFCLCSLISNSAAQTVLQAYIDSALKNNHSLKVYQLQAKALEEKIKPSQIIDDPMIYGGIMNLPTNLSFSEDMMTMKQIGIQQNFSVRRKYNLRRAIAQKEFEMSSYEVKAQQLSLTKEVKQQYYELYAQNKSIETAKSSIHIMESYLDITKTRYSSGQGPQQDIFKAELQIIQMKNELLKLQNERESRIATFNSLLARNQVDSVIVPTKIIFHTIHWTLQSLTNTAQTNNPILLLAKKSLSKDSTAYLLTKTTKTPDFNAGVWYGQRQANMPDGTKARDMIGLSFGLTLPIYAKQKQSPLIHASAIDIQKEQAQLAKTKNELELQIHHAFIEANNNERLINLYEKQLIPLATESLQTGMIGYQQNKIDFMALIDGFISLYNHRLQHDQAIANYLKTLAELEMLTGQNLIEE
ncbi:MAG: TolC family protein [Sphingobacteriaceae bacterium]